MRRAARYAGYELVPIVPGPLERLRGAGVVPATVIDAGAALGDWSIACAGIWPAARYLLVEPLAEFHPQLAAVAGRLQHAEVVHAAVSSVTGEQEINVHRDLVGSSLLREREGPHVDGTPRRVQTTTIDALVTGRTLEPPFLLKLDVQGAERDVLLGARDTLAAAAAVQVEVSFFSFFEGGAPFAEIVELLGESGLVVYDITGLSHRPLDGALGQADIVFVPEASPVRRDHVYASSAQRAAQDAEFAATMRRRLGGSRR
jgi:FkbM family methyltransferase